MKPNAVDNQRRATVLVTGGAGFIGSHISEALLTLGWRVYALDDLSAGSAENIGPGVRLHVGDIRSDADLRGVFREAEFDAVIHCAAQTSVHRSMLNPDLDRHVNVNGTRRLLAVAKACAVRRFVFISSGGAIYGETDVPATERAMPAPRSYYGFHKYAAEHIVRAAEMPYAILRPSNVYGPRQRADIEGGVVAIFLERLLTGQPMEIHGSGLQTRDFVHVSDVVSAVVAALAFGGDALWNVASGEAVTVLGLAETIALLGGQPAQLVYRDRREGDIECSLLSAAALLATGLWSPPLPIAMGLRLTLAEAARRLTYNWRFRPVGTESVATSVSGG